MNSDLHARIRDALAAEEIDASDLTEPGLRAPIVHRPAHRGIAVAAAVVVVVLAATTLGTAVSRHRDNTVTSSSHALDGVAGYRWKVTSVSDAHGTVTPAASWGASVAFSRSGTVFGDDTINGMSGNYRTVKGGYTVTTIVSTTTGYRGDDPVRQRIIIALDSLFGRPDGGPSGNKSFLVAVELHDGALTLRHGGVTVTATRAGGQPDPRSTPAPTTTEAFHYHGPVARKTVTAGGSLVLRPPGAAVARVTPAQALHNLCARGVASPCTAAVDKPDVALALLTTPNTGHVRADGTIKSSVDNVLSYVISWRHIPCPITGGPAPRGTVATSRPVPRLCTVTDAVNANTGKANAGEYYDG